MARGSRASCGREAGVGGGGGQGQSRHGEGGVQECCAGSADSRSGEIGRNEGAIRWLHATATLDAGDDA